MMIKHLRDVLAIGLGLLTLPASAQMWKATSALKTSEAQYLVAADHVKTTVYAVGNNQELVYSKDKGDTWTKQDGVKPAKQFAALKGVSDRLYASFKINTFDFLIAYSKDDGKTWVVDTVGLPMNITKTGKKSLNIRDLGNDYVLAFDATASYLKKVEETTWRKIEIDPVVTVEVTAHDGDWYAVGVNKLLKSDDNGENWSTISTTGLPANFQANTIVSNGKNRLFICSSPASGGVDVYYSDDKGKSWTITNSKDIYTHQNPFIGSIHAVDDYVFAAVAPVFADKDNPPPFISSSTPSPKFEAGDTSGLIRGNTNTSLPFFFHIEDKLFTMFWELYESEPGFDDQGNSTVEDNWLHSQRLYPNPAHSMLHVPIANAGSWEVVNALGKVVMAGSDSNPFAVDVRLLSPGTYVFRCEKGRSLFIAR
ncbi:MAG: T9SS type A sorting domain-containing protein [Bacteroidia bacterium]|nr:T9SS type A sorting domain-containing protein [Bacteroidia bacterium]